MKFIDLFCGIGGFRVALESLGHTCVFSSEIDPKAQESYQANFGEVPHGDITKIAVQDIATHDILCAGFPCHPFSLSGKRKAFEDDRGQLFYEIIRIAKFHKSPILLLENVPHLLKVGGGEIFKAILDELRNLGYDMHFDTLNASFFGIPQSRKRLYIVCLRRGAGLSYSPPKPCYTPVVLADFLDKKIDPKTLISEKLRNKVKLRQKATQLTLDGLEVSNLEPVMLGVVGNGGQGQFIYSTHGHAVTQTASMGGLGVRTGLYLTNEGIRTLSLTEGKRVMGFSKKHIVGKGYHGYRQLGNAVIPKMIQLVFQGIR